MLTNEDLAVLAKPLTEEGLDGMQKLLAQLEVADLKIYARPNDHCSSSDQEQAVREYKQFHLLIGFCLVKGVVPNLALTHRADRVWHRHLEDEENYKKFCLANHGVLIAHIEVSRKDERPVKREVYEAYSIMHLEIGRNNRFFSSSGGPGFPYVSQDEGKLFPRCHSGIA